MTQIEESSSAANPDPPRALAQICEALNDLIQTRGALHSDPVRITEPIRLIYLISHILLTHHDFKLHPPTDQTADALLWDLVAPTPAHHAIPSIHVAYSHRLSSFRFELNFSRLAQRISIAAAAASSPQALSQTDVLHDAGLCAMDLSISDLMDSNHFPLVLSPLPGSPPQCPPPGFRSSGHLLSFATDFVNQVLHVLLPGVVAKIQSASRSGAPPDPLPPDDPRRPRPPARSAARLPGHELGSTGPAQLARPAQPGVGNPLEIGRSDLDPVGTCTLRIPSLYNQPLGRFGNGHPRIPTDDGMLVGPGHSIFHRAFGPATGPICPTGMGPPGARYDPVGPGLPHRMDPMGGLGQGLPSAHFHPGYSFNDVHPPNDPGGYDNMFM